MLAEGGYPEWWLSQQSVNELRARPFWIPGYAENDAK